MLNNKDNNKDQQFKNAGSSADYVQNNAMSSEVATNSDINTSAAKATFKHKDLNKFNRFRKFLGTTAVLLTLPLIVTVVIIGIIALGHRIISHI